jgi:hypothetical protein
VQPVDQIGVVAAALAIAIAMAACVVSPAATADPSAVVSGSPATALNAASYPPPPKRAEIPPRPPSAQALWRSGYWSWNGEQYVWMRGHYVQRPSPTANWLPGYWEQQREGWKWVEGQWSS